MCGCLNVSLHFFLSDRCSLFVAMYFFLHYPFVMQKSKSSFELSAITAIIITTIRTIASTHRITIPIKKFIRNKMLARRACLIFRRIRCESKKQIRSRWWWSRFFSLLGLDFSSFGLFRLSNFLWESHRTWSNAYIPFNSVICISIAIHRSVFEWVNNHLKFIWDSIRTRWHTTTQLFCYAVKLSR